jgi:hypothetical protein
MICNVQGGRIRVYDVKQISASFSVHNPYVFNVSARNKIIRAKIAEFFFELTGDCHANSSQGRGWMDGAFVS